MNSQHKLNSALGKRRELLESPDTDAIRLFNGLADGIDGLVIERFGPVLVAQLHEGRLKLSESQVRDLCESARETLRVQAVYRKIFVRERGGKRPHIEALHTDPTPWLGEPVDPEIAAKENGLRFLIRPYEGFSTGLFLEQRDNRRRIREMAGGLRVLNVFSYTCGFSVAAALGGALSTVSVDVSKKHLEWGKRNFKLNDVNVGAPREPAGVGAAVEPASLSHLVDPAESPAAPSPHVFICSDAFDYYKRADRQKRRFDLVVVDPPSFSRAGKSGRVFSIKDDLPELLAGAIGLLAPRGRLLLSTNFRPISLRRMEHEISDASGGRKTTIVSRPALPIDFRGDQDYAKTLLARFD